MILPDGVRNYMTKFVDEKWMKDNGFASPEASEGVVKNILSDIEERSLITIELNASANEAVNLMKKQGISQLPVTYNNSLVGIITEDHLLQCLSSYSTETSTMEDILERSVPTVELSTPIAVLQDTVIKNGFAIVLNDTKEPVQILTKIDLVDWMSSKA